MKNNLLTTLILLLSINAFSQCVLTGSGALTRTAQANNIQQAIDGYTANDSMLLYFVLEETIEILPTEIFQIDTVLFSESPIEDFDSKVLISATIIYDILECAQVNFNPNQDSTDCFEHEIFGWTCPETKDDPVPLMDFVEICTINHIEKGIINTIPCDQVEFNLDVSCQVKDAKMCDLCVYTDSDGNVFHVDCSRLVYEPIIQISLNGN